MQTFLPYNDIQKTVECLDWKRLGCQRKESWQILCCLKGIHSLRWKYHPAVKMWAGYENYLTMYMNNCIIEWIKRGYNNTMEIMTVDNIVVPDWFGGPIHASHRSALLHKNIEWYGKFGWTEEPKMEYYWPTKNV
jgi:hypothetical protein